jgi:SNF2 family DNA or RNA helicase
MQVQKMNLRCGRGTKAARVGIDENNIFFAFPYSPLLVQSMKEMEKYQYYGFPDARLRDYVLEHFKTDKVWSAKITQRNLFFFDWLRGNNPYEYYKQPWEPLKCRFPLWDHQGEMAGFILKRRRCVVAGDMSVGKTLAVFAAMEEAFPERPEGNWLYVCPTHVREEIGREADKWGARVRPDEIIGYQRMRINVRNGIYKKPPQVLVLDEGHALKDPQSLQTRAAQHLANWGREVWKENFYCILMSGTPSPQEPSDWWSLCEIVQPGFLAEINTHRLKDRLALMEINDYGHGEVKEVKQWLDRDGLCRNCGKEFSEKGVTAERVKYPCCDEPVKAKNEVKALYTRMENRIAYFVRKGEVLDLPDLKREIIRIEPSDEVMDLARGYIAVSEGGADAINILRQVSDGFRYENVVVGEESCSCQDGLIKQFVPKVDFLPEPGDMTETEYREKYFELSDISCPECMGSGIKTKTERKANFFGSPKYDIVTDLLKDYEEHGRAIVAAGFKGTVDKLCEIVKDAGWEWLRCDGRGWATSSGFTTEKLLEVFNNGFDMFPKLALIGNPASIGAGLNLQVSRCIIVVSNSFNSKDRIQLENRIHRPGMDREHGGRIYDIYYLPSDEYTMQKIEIKRARQDITMGLDVDMNEIEALFGVTR